MNFSHNLLGVLVFREVDALLRSQKLWLDQIKACGEIIAMLQVNDFILKPVS